MAKKNKPFSADESGVFVYIGPSIRGIVQNGSIFTGTINEVKAKLSTAIEKYPKVERLIIRDVDLAEAREKIKSGGNSLSIAFNALLSAY